MFLLMFLDGLGGVWMGVFWECLNGSFWWKHKCKSYIVIYIYILFI